MDIEAREIYFDDNDRTAFTDNVSEIIACMPKEEADRTTGGHFKAYWYCPNVLPLFLIRLAAFAVGTIPNGKDEKYDQYSSEKGIRTSTLDHWSSYESARP